MPRTDDDHVIRLVHVVSCGVTNERSPTSIVRKDRYSLGFFLSLKTFSNFSIFGRITK